MSDENKKFGGLRLKTDDTNETTATTANTVNTATTANTANTEHTENKQSVSQNLFDDTKLNFDDNVYSGKTNSTAKVDRPNWTFFLFVVIGILIIFVQINTIRDMALAKRLKKSGQRTGAQITDVDRNYRRRAADTYSVYVDYEVDGKVYKHVYIGRKSTYVGTGDFITVYYDEKDPRKVVSDFASTQNKVYFFIRWCILAGIIVIGYHAYKDPDEVSESMLNGLTSGRRRW